MLREQIARVICCFAKENKNCTYCEYNTPKTPFPDCFPDILLETGQILALVQQEIKGVKNPYLKVASQEDESNLYLTVEQFREAILKALEGK